MNARSVFMLGHIDKLSAFQLALITIVILLAHGLLGLGVAATADFVDDVVHDG
jgi:hypothetical protein